MSIPGTAIAVTVISAAIAVFALLPSLANSRLTVVEQLVNWRYSTPPITADDLQHLAQRPAPPLIFDVRAPEEYAISHIPEAINVSPTLTATEFLQQFGQGIDGKKLVFYCSVGQRSSALADRLRNSERLPKANEVFNLRGGIFRWAAAGLPMKNQQGKTAAIHPYNKLGAKLLPPEAETLTELSP